MLFVVALYIPKDNNYEYIVEKNLKSAHAHLSKTDNMSFIGEVRNGKCATIHHCSIHQDNAFMEFWMIDAYIKGLNAKA